MATPAAVLNLAVIANTATANTALAGTQARLRAVAATSTKTGLTMKKAFLGIGIAAGLAGKALYDVGAQFDEVSDTIRTQTGASGKELAKLEGSFKKVVKTVPTDFNSAATAVAGLNQRLHLTGKPLTELSRQITALAKVTGTDVQENVESITRLFGDWGIATDKQRDTLDELFRVTQSTGIALSDLSRLMVQFGSPLRQLGLDFDTAAVMFARFEREGVNIQTLMPGLRMALKNFSAPTAELSATMKKLGIDLREGPSAALAEVMDAIKGAGSDLKANALAFQIFGARAGPDMAAAIREGRFELGDLIKEMNAGKTTITGSERATRDFSEQWDLFANRLKVFIEPIATAFFDAVGKGMRAINRLDLNKVIASLREFWQSAGLLRDTISKVAGAIKANLQGLKQFIEGAVQAISGILTGDFGRAWRGVKNIFTAGVKNMVAILRAITAPFRAALDAIADIIHNVFNDAWRSAKNTVSSAVDSIMGNIHLLGNALDKGFTAIANFTNKALDAFGAKKVKFDVGDISPFQTGGVIVPGSGNGDKVPAMLEPGEVVWNKRAVAAMGGAGAANAINSAVPRFASGGIAGDTAGLHPGILGLLNSLSSKFGGSVTSGLRASDSGSLHSTGQAADYVPSDWAGASRAVNAVGSKLLEGIYNPGMFGGSPVSWDTGSHVASSFWGSEWGNHLDHIHLAIADGVKAVAGGMAREIKRVMLKGPDGPLKNMGQSALDKVRGAANAYLGRHSGFTGDTGSGVRPYNGPLDRTFPSFSITQGFAGQTQLSPKQVTSLANKAGLPGSTFEKIAHGESNYFPGVMSTDGGYGLWQMTPRVQSAETVAAWKGIGSYFNPWANAQQAKYLYDRASSQTPGTPGFPWYGTQFLASGGIAGKMAKIAKGGHLTGSPLFGLDLHPAYHGEIGKPGGKPPSYTPNPMGPGTRPPAQLSPGIQSALNNLGYVIAIIDEQIANAETLSGFSTSEMGTALGPGEKAEQIALNESLLQKLVQGAVLIKQGLGTPFLNLDTVSELSGALFDIQGITGQGGRILSTRQKLDSLYSTDAASSTLDNSELLALLQAQNLMWQQRYNVSQAQYGVFGGMPMVGGPGFQGGGAVNVAAPNVNVNITGNDSALTNFIRAVVQQENRSASSSRVLPGARGV